MVVDYAKQKQFGAVKGHCQAKLNQCYNCEYDW